MAAATKTRKKAPQVASPPPDSEDQKAALDPANVNVEFWQRWKTDHEDATPSRVPPPDVSVLWNEGTSGQWVAKFQQGPKMQYVHDVRTLAANQLGNFERNQAFGRAYEGICDQYEADLGADGTREQILGLIVALLDQKCCRPGNETSAKKGHLGLTTLQNRNVILREETKEVVLVYKGKMGKWQRKFIMSDELWPLMVQLKEAAGDNRRARFFQFDGDPIRAPHVNAYLKKFKVTAKQFRQFHATRIATEVMMEALAKAKGKMSDDDIEQTIADAKEAVAAHLGNEPGTAETHYIDPTFIEAFRKGRLAKFLSKRDDPYLEDLKT